MPVFGPIKRAELIRDLKMLGFELMPEANTSTWSKEKSDWRFPIRIKATLGATCSPEFCGKLE